MKFSSYTQTQKVVDFLCCSIFVISLSQPTELNNSIDINKLNLENTFIKKKAIELIVKEIQKKDYFDISDNQMTEIIKWYKSIEDDDTYLYLGACENKEKFYEKQFMGNLEQK